MIDTVAGAKSSAIIYNIAETAKADVTRIPCKQTPGIYDPFKTYTSKLFTMYTEWED
ncbi:MAG: hypothetical protein K2O13_09770 [Lachnospiraceae bacterium]|nr:hypothetical protein [Lachnospiraceae bacterium]